MDTGLVSHSLGLFGRKILKSRLDASAIVVAFYVREQVTLGLLPGGPAPLVDELDLKRVEEAFYGRIEAPMSVKTLRRQGGLVLVVLRGAGRSRGRCSV